MTKRNTTEKASPVQLTQEAFTALKAQAAGERRTLQEVASYAIMEYVNANRERGQQP